jgi:hypothetical protein
MSSPRPFSLTDEAAQRIAFELCSHAAAGASDAEITSRLLGTVLDEHGVDGALAVIAATVRALAGLLHLSEVR